MNQNPEQKARDHIDRMFQASGWTIQVKSSINLHAATGVAVRDTIIKIGNKSRSQHNHQLLLGSLIDSQVLLTIFDNIQVKM